MTRYKPNSGKHILYIINRIACAKHDAEKGAPCFTLHYDHGKSKTGPAICGTRVFRAGFNGQIHPNSLGQTVPAGPSRYRKG